MIHKLIFDPIFRSETLFYTGAKSKDIIAHAKKKYNININTYSFDDFKGSCVECECTKTGIVVWMVNVNKSKDWKTMAHEAAHLVFRILDERGVKYDSNNDETWCYLHEYFLSEFWNVMCNSRKYKIKG